MDSNFLKQALVFLSAAVFCVPIAKKLGMGSVLGYLFAGVIIGPYVLGFAGNQGEDIMHASEFGVVMMLFLIGLELNPRALWNMRKVIVGMGLLQTILTVIIVAVAGYTLMGWSYRVSLAVSVGISLSSTAMVLQTLNEKGINKTSGGKASFSVLLFQDILVIPILAFLPLLAETKIAGNTENYHLLSNLPTWAQTIIIIGAILFIGIFGRFAVIPLLRIIAKTGLREMFTAVSLLLVVAVSYLMQLVGLSPALGAFLAGVVLANSEYRHALESDLEPFKGLLLGLFFVGVGVSMNISLIIAQPVLLFALTGSIIIIKAIALFISGKVFKLQLSQNFLFSIILSQVGEFGFIIFTFNNELNIISTGLKDILMATTALSIPYSYQWDDLNQQTNATAVYLTKDWYTVTVTDANNCVITDSVFIGILGMIPTNILQVQVYPNPTVDALNFSENIDAWTLFDVKGSKINQGNTASQISVQGLSEGVYYLHFSKQGWSFTEKIIKLSEHE